jgi:hypothetical protein
MSQTSTSMTQTPVAGGTPRALTLPPGWYLPGGDGLADMFSGAGLATANAPADPALPGFRLVTTPTALQQQALELLGVSHRLGVA